MKTGSPRVLVVDPDAAEAAVARTQLSGFANVEIAPDVPAALALAKDAVPDIVVVDATLFDPLRLALLGVPFVVLTPHHRTGLELHALERGAIDAIAKPLSRSALRARVRTHLRVRSLSNELRAAASIDGLTGLANRRSFFHHINEEHAHCVREQRAMHLLLIELDDLAALATRHGRATADACLTRVARAIAQNVREHDMVARIEGSRIAVVLHDASTRGAAIVARRLGDAVRALAIRHEASASGVVTISVVIGHLAASVDGTRSAARLVDGSERAMMQAKEGEPGQVWFYDVAV